MEQMRTFKEKGYVIKIWEQEPNVSYEEAFENDGSLHNIHGSHAYEVFNPKGESIYKDDWDMWDEDACYQNACQDVDADLGEKSLPIPYVMPEEENERY